MRFHNFVTSQLRNFALMKYVFNIIAVLGLIGSLTLAGLFFTQRDRLTITQTEAKDFLEKLENFQQKQKDIFEEIRSIQSSISNLNRNIKDKTLMLAEHNMRLNEVEYFVNEIFLNPAKLTLIESNDFLQGGAGNKKFLVEKFRESDSFLSEIEDAEIIEDDPYEAPSEDMSGKIEEEIIYYLSTDDYSTYKNSFLESQEFDRLSDLITTISGNEVTPLSVHQHVELTIAAFEESEKIREKNGEDYKIPTEDFDELMLLRSSEFLSDSQFSSLEKFIEGE